MSRFRWNYRFILRRHPRLYQLALVGYACAQFKTLTFSKEQIVIRSRRRQILISSQNINYAREIIDFFDFYFNSVVADQDKYGNSIIDFSRRKSHSVLGFELMPIIFPSVSEPLETINQYLEILNLQPGEVILDLGAYSAFSSILFFNATNAKVVAVEADPKCQGVIVENLENYRFHKKHHIELYPYAIYSSDGFIEFLSEGTMASTVIDKNLDSWKRPELITRVETKTLSSLALDLGLARVDVIKADIEGAEFDAFQDSSFFKNHHPRILIEPISEDGLKGSVSIKKLLKTYGYSNFTIIHQEGARSPLMLCI